METTTARAPRAPAQPDSHPAGVDLLPGPAGSARADEPAAGRLDLEIVVPVHNEETMLAASIERLVGYLDDFPFATRITIADNASTDGTLPLAFELAQRHSGMHVLYLAEKGRGRALRRAWLNSPATVVAYMDVDLSTDLDALLPLVAPLLSGHSDVAIGSRLARGSRVVRGPRREFISRSYNLLLRACLGVRFSDAQCGFKAVRADTARQLIPLVEDQNWFFDTELLTLAERAGIRIHEVPVDWVDDPDSRVDIVATAKEDLLGIWRLTRGFACGRIALQPVREALRPAQAPQGAALRPFDELRDRGDELRDRGDELRDRGDELRDRGDELRDRGDELRDRGDELRDRTGGSALAEPERTLLSNLVRFGIVGIGSTILFALLFLVFREVLPAQAANVIALLLATFANTAVNRRFTYGIRGRDGAVRHQMQGYVVLGIALAITSASLALLHLFVPTPERWVELAVLTAANLAATLVRFLLFRSWVFNRKEVER